MHAVKYKKGNRFNDIHNSMTCGDIDQCSNSKVQRINIKQDQSKHGPLKNGSRIRCYGGVSILCWPLHQPCSLSRNNISFVSSEKCIKIEYYNYHELPSDSKDKCYTNKTFLYHTTKQIKEPKTKCFLKNAGDEIYELVISDNNDDNQGRIIQTLQKCIICVIMQPLNIFALLNNFNLK